MHKWKIDILLKNGTKLFGVYKTDYEDSADVVESLVGAKATPWFGIFNRHETANLVVNTVEIAAMEITPIC